MGSPCPVKMSGVSALLGKVENAPATSAANPNLIIVFISLVSLVFSISRCCGGEAGLR